MGKSRPHQKDGYHQTVHQMEPLDTRARFDPAIVGNFTVIEGKVTHANGIELEEYSKEELIGILQATTFFMLAAKRLPMNTTDNIRYVPFKDNGRGHDRSKQY